MCSDAAEGNSAAYPVAFWASRTATRVVQWNAGYYPRNSAVWLGVNLEGMKYDGWPVAATHRARDLPSASPDPVSPEGRNTR